MAEPANQSPHPLIKKALDEKALDFKPPIARLIGLEVD